MGSEPPRGNHEMRELRALAILLLISACLLMGVPLIASL
jgi:hypothetical protein